MKRGAGSQGRTGDHAIEVRIREVRAAIDGHGVEGLNRQERATYLFGWADAFREFATELEGRQEMVGDNINPDWSVLNWPEKLRGVADEAERAAEVCCKAPGERTAAETMYPGMQSE
jgi:hypothetical protein